LSLDVLNVVKNEVISLLQGFDFGVTGIPVYLRRIRACLR